MAGTSVHDGPRTPLQRECAVKCFGDIEMNRVRAMLRNGEDCNKLDCFQRSPLSLLCENSGHVEAGRALIAAGALATTEDMWGRTPLHWCADRGWLDIARLLLSNGASVDVATKHGDSILLWAAKVGHVALVELFLNAGCNPLLQNNRGETAVDVAADDMIRTLLISKLQNGAPTKQDDRNLSRKCTSFSSQESHLSLAGQIDEGNEEPKRQAVKEPTIECSPAAFSLYTKQTSQLSSVPKKMKITLRKK